MISVTFAVLFIGLGIDYSIQYCLRYRELIESGITSGDAHSRTAQGVGKSLFLCTLTTSVGFFAFVPTAYTGVSELGLISGTGMFINFFANLTVLPAVLSLIHVKKGRILPLSLSMNFTMLPYKYSKTITTAAILVGMGAALLVPRVFFNFNPISLYNQKAESVSTAKELFEDPETSPWTAAVLVKSMEDTKILSSALNDLKEVDMTISIADFIPKDQQEKLDIISDISLFMPHTPDPLHLLPLTSEIKIEALNRFEEDLKNLLSTTKEGMFLASAQHLYKTMGDFNKALQKDPVQGKHLINVLEKALLTNLPLLLKNFKIALQADVFGEGDLPPALIERYVSQDKRYRVQVFPSENITKIIALKHFVNAIRSITRDVTDSPVVVLETGKAIIASFRQASLSALIVITLILLIVLKSIRGTLLILIPLLLAVLMTSASSVLLDIPFNYANIIVIPLLLGIGVDYGIHFIHRFNTEPPEDGNMLKTSTSRAVLFSALTTIMSFSSLSFLSHEGTASMGKLLSICMSFLILNTLVLLPALLDLHGKYIKKSINISNK
jgi:hopanoid biosynthesis associated RND transporter like protein HpnN